MIAAMKSGHCATPQTDDPHLSHERCQRKGGGNTARPDKDFQPCPCSCHLQEGDDGLALYECEECGGLLGLALNITDEDGDAVYVHLNAKGDMAGEFPWECGSKPTKTTITTEPEPEPEPQPGETYYDPLLGEVTVGKIEEEEEDDFSDLDDLDDEEEEDEFADLDDLD